jgi:sugar lactone lactonase YvrE
MRLQSLRIPAIILPIALALALLAGCGGSGSSSGQTTGTTKTYVAVADWGNNRVLIYDSPFTTDMNASVVLGQSDFTTGVQATSATGLSYPRATAIDGNGNLWVADEYNSRVLEFKTPFTSGMSASLVIGQGNFTTSGLATSQNGLNYATGLAFDPSGNLWVADTFNSRILEFVPPFSNGMNASLVIGQQDYTSGSSATTASGLGYPWAITFDSSGNLWVADSGNSRVLEFKTPFTSGMSASLVIGQQNYTSGTSVTSASGFNGPVAIVFDSSDNLWVAEEANNRVLEFKTPLTTGMSASLVIGQGDFTTAGSSTSQDGLYAPNGVAFDSASNLWVADRNNNRTLEFTPPFTTNQGASLVLGQESFTTNTPATTATGQALPMGVTAF